MILPLIRQHLPTHQRLLQFPASRFGGLFLPFPSPPPDNNCWEVELPFDQPSEIQLPPCQRSTLGVLVTIHADLNRGCSAEGQSFSSAPDCPSTLGPTPGTCLDVNSWCDHKYLISPHIWGKGENHINHQDGVIPWHCNSCTKIYYQETRHGLFSMHEWMTGQEAPAVASEMWSGSALSQLRVRKQVWATAHRFPWQQSNHHHWSKKNNHHHGHAAFHMVSLLQMKPWACKLPKQYEKCDMNWPGTKGLITAPREALWTKSIQGRQNTQTTPVGMPACFWMSKSTFFPLFSVNAWYKYYCPQ